MKYNTAKPNKKSAKKRLSLKSEILYVCSCCAVVVLMVLTTLNLKTFTGQNTVLGTSQAFSEEKLYKLNEKKAYWQSFTAVNPDYLDGWIELIRINMELGNKNQASEMFNKARIIDPNSTKLDPYRGVFKE